MNRFLIFWSMLPKLSFAGRISGFLEKSLGKRVLVSACLVGWKCRYNAVDCYSPILFSYAEEYRWSLVPVCPEVLGGLDIPRLPAIISGGSAIDVWEGRATIMNSALKNVTKFFLDGAKKALAVAERTRCGFAVLKERSPSCGVNAITNMMGTIRKGQGITSQLLLTNGIKIISDEELFLFHQRGNNSLTAQFDKKKQ